MSEKLSDNEPQGFGPAYDDFPAKGGSSGVSNMSRAADTGQEAWQKW